MASTILRCKQCHTYSIAQTCKHCGGTCVMCKPPRYSVEDKYAKYRRMAKEEEQNIS